MPNPRNTGHRIRAGTYAAAGVTSGYAIESFPVQTDQIVDNATMVPWLAPMKITVPEYGQVYTMVDGSRRPGGFLAFTWEFGYLTFGMVSYWISTVWPSGVYSAAVTVMTYDATDTAVFVQCQAYRPKIPDDVEWFYAGYQNFKIKFDFGVVTT